MAKAKDRLSDAKPYVTRAFQDEEVRENVKSAIAAAREIYDELIVGRRPTAVAARVATDKEIQENLRTAIDDLKKAANRVQGKKEHSTRNATLLFTGIVLGILFNPLTGPQTREWISGRLFGEGEDDTSAASGGNSGSGS
jgi:F0F1-type ATP synthase membrane subunit b/b'